MIVSKHQAGLLSFIASSQTKKSTPIDKTIGVDFILIKSDRLI